MFNPVFFVIMILIWLFDGFVGLLNCKNNSVNWNMITFLLVFPLLPLLASLCGLF